MNDPATLPEGYSLNLLLFSIGGVSFGIDAEQVEAIGEFNTDNVVDYTWSHELVNFGDNQPEYNSPTILFIKSPLQSSCQIVIDCMEDVTEYSVNAICPFPSLIEPYLLSIGMWGMLQRGGKIVLLLDLMQMIANADKQKPAMFKKV